MRWPIHFLKNQLMEHSATNELKGNLHQLINVFLSKVEWHGLIEAPVNLRKKT